MVVLVRVGDEGDVLQKLGERGFLFQPFVLGGQREELLDVLFPALLAVIVELVQQIVAVAGALQHLRNEVRYPCCLRLLDEAVEQLQEAQERRL